MIRLLEILRHGSLINFKWYIHWISIWVILHRSKFYVNIYVNLFCLTILSYAIEINIYVWTKKYKLKIISKWEIRPHVWSLVWKEFAFFLCNLFSSIHCKIELQLSLKMITDEFKCSYKRISNVIWAPIMANALDARIKVHLMWKDIFYIDGTYAALK